MAWDDVKNFFGRAIGGATKAVGDFIGSPSVSKWGGDLVTKCTKVIADTSESVSRRKAYDRERASAEDVIDINDDLATFKNQIVLALSGVHQDARQLISNYAKAMKANASTTLGDYDLSLDFSAVEKCVKRIELSLEATSLTLINGRVSITNGACTDILEMPQGTAKRNAMERFTKASVNLCIDAIGNEIESGCKQIDAEVVKALDSKIADLKRHTESTRKGLQTLVAARNTDQKTKEIAKASTMFTVDSCIVAQEMLAYASSVPENA